MNTAFEIPPYIVGERHGQDRKTFILPDNADLQSIMNGRAATYPLGGRHGAYPSLLAG